MKLFRMLLCICVLLIGNNIFSQEKKFLNTVSFDSIKGSPKATLASLKWLPGFWQGEAFGGITEEVWTPASGGSMMCAFKLISKGVVEFYEIVTIAEEKESLVLKLKHFHGNLKGWEEKDQVLEFKLVKIEGNKVFFDDLTYEKVSDNEMNAFVVVDFGNGKKEEVKFNFRRGRL
ncbi:DUF6265 family protein [Pollutibacter soli]|uniref:DUF6265 family protein n=1 Tax=Pollutibacter soli TaxID=3034157 RepID=UPI00301419B1